MMGRVFTNLCLQKGYIFAFDGIRAPFFGTRLP